MKYFISHSGNDSDWTERILKIISEVDSEIVIQSDVFFSSKAETGSDAKEKLLMNIDNNMSGAETIILFVTENYLRSIFCFYELSFASFYSRNGKNVILLVQSQNVYERIMQLFPGDMYIDAEKEMACDQFINAIAKNSHVSDICREEAENLFASMRKSPLPVGSAFLGMSKEQYNNVVLFAEKYGIEFMTLGYPSTPDIVNKKLKGAKNVYFVTTTGSGFLKTYKRVLTEAIKNGTHLYVVIADCNSQFCKDVGKIEVFDSNGGDNVSSNNCARISAEFDSTMQYLNEIYSEAHQFGDGSTVLGRITCCSGYTLIRQTVFLISYEEGEGWGWMTSTMPPERCADNTPSFVFKSGAESNQFVKVVNRYCESLVNFALKCGGAFEIDGISSHNGFEIEKKKKTDVIDQAKLYWREKYRKAKENMEYRDSIYDAVLIEVAAQHPLLKKKLPNTEFRERLNKAIEMYKQLTAKGVSVTVYVPGSRHMFNGVADDISLSEAGYTYLKENGVPEDDLLGENMNKKYKGDSGVYNSADECYVSSKIFEDGEYGKFVCICSPNQVARKTMLYIEFGVLPQCHSVTTDRLFHGDIVSEIFDSLNTVLYTDHSWQSTDSECYISSRKERRPK